MCPSGGKYIQNFLAPKILTLSKRIFSGKVKFEANRETKMIIGGFGGMLPRKSFEILHTVMGILALFEKFATQILFFCP